MFIEYIADPCINFADMQQHAASLNDSNIQDENIFQEKVNHNQMHEKKVTIKDLLKRTGIKKKKKSKSRSKLGRYSIKNQNPKKPAGAGYKKNLCGYITKKGIRQFVYGNYKKKIEQLCIIQQVDFQIAKNFYDNKIQIVTGPSHLSQLFETLKADQIPIIKVFVKFFIWFLQERYMRHLLKEGKMQDKKAYINYKNSVLLPMVYIYEKRSFQYGLNSSTLHAQQLLNAVL